MKTEAIIYVLTMILGIFVAIAPWTFAPVCVTEMRCWFTRDVETVLGVAIAILSFLGMYISLGTAE
ncbi:MAG: DUF4418 family protein [Candidatus Thorarchaeota archaeon]|nr:DUF4418 family protein [Candidatus Thorarchaeota archaeon]